MVPDKILDIIQQLIQSEHLAEAKELADEYFLTAPDNIELLSTRVVLAFLSSNLIEAEKLLEQGLLIDSNHRDLLFNKAYLLEQKGELREALDLYTTLEFTKTADSPQYLQEIQLAKRRIAEKIQIELPVLKKIAFFVKSGMDSFLNDIIMALSTQYEVEKYIITDLRQIDEPMQSADICWFEWCDELIIYASQQPFAQGKKIICRLHSYEAFIDYPTQVNWQVIDKVIFVAQHIRDAVLAVGSSLKKEQTIIIPNGIVLDKYSFKERKVGFKIAYLGYINYKKGPMLLLHTFKAIYDKDHRYQLYIAGQFQDNRDVLYFEQMIQELGLSNNVFYEGWQKDVNHWLDDKNYIICTSILEGHPVGIMEGMAKGLKPLIHNFVGAKRIFPNEYIWNTIQECVKQVRSPEYSSPKYRQYIQLKYSKEEQIRKILDLFLENKTSEKIISQHKLGNPRRYNALESDKENIPVKISLILLINQYYKELERQLETFLAQSYENLEIVIVDNSLDDASEVLVKSLSIDKRITYKKMAGNISLGDEKSLYSCASGEYALIVDKNTFFDDRDYITKKATLCFKNDRRSQFFYCMEDFKKNFHEPLVTIGITNYNAECYVKQCIESVLQQSYSNVEIIAIDDVSSDASIQILRDYSSRYNNFKLIEHTENSGSPDQGRMEIIREAKGKYFMFVDSDDYFADCNAVEKFVEVMKNDTTIDYVYCNLQVVDAEGKYKDVWKGSQFNKEKIVHDTFQRGGSGILNMKGLFKREFFLDNNIQYLSNGTAGDTLTILSCMRFDMRIVYLNENAIAYRQHDNNFTFDIKKRIDSVITILEYIVRYFDEKVYFSEQDWNGLSEENRKANKYYLIIALYFAVFKQYYEGEWKPWGNKNDAKSISEDEIKKCLYPLYLLLKQYSSSLVQITNVYNKDIMNMKQYLESIYKSE